MKNLLFRMPGILPFVSLLLLGSCYWLWMLDFSTHEVAPGGEFTVNGTLTSDRELYIHDGYACLGVCVPDGWEVSDVEYHYRGHGKEKDVPLKSSDIYTDVLNYRYLYVKESDTRRWRWVGFCSDEKIANTLGGDCRIYFTATIKAGYEVGDYKLEFLMGDEEDCLEKYQANMDYDPQSDERICYTGTFEADPSKEDQKRLLYVEDEKTGELLPDLDEYGNQKYEIVPSIRRPATEYIKQGAVNTDITVTESAGVAAIGEDNFEIIGGTGGLRVISSTLDGAVATVYDAQGRVVDTQLVRHGEASLKASKGLCLVQIVKGDGKTVKKIFVK